MLKRLFDIIFAALGLLVLSPVFLIISAIIGASSRGPVFYLQSRVGRNNKDFRLFKFRTMHPAADQKGLLTIGGNDPRITRSGHFLRKYKLDELPQLLNVLVGDMSFVGPRPEVRKYVNLYTPEQAAVLQVRPGITDYASLQYFNESELLGASADPDKTYTTVIMPSKLELNLKYIREAGLLTDLQIIFRTLRRIFS
jgi:lipopolysaccharide/colanic/teichoic acid biosynthesis glycosyltransferase